MSENSRSGFCSIHLVLQGQRDIFVLRFILFFVVGKKILVLNGGYRGNEGILESINEKTFSATIVIETVSVCTKTDIPKCF